MAKKKKTKIITYVNMPGSMMTRIADVAIMANAGPEICVMSTKVVLSQMAFGYLLASHISENSTKAKKDLTDLANTIDEVLNDKGLVENIKDVAEILSTQSDIYLLGKREGYFVSQEGMIKMVEGAYIHAHALPAGDLKHYVITIVEDETPVIGLVTNDEIKKDLQSALTEVKARGATTFAITQFKDFKADHLLILPELKVLNELIALVLLQLLSYFIAKKLGHNIDKPRHIAKSVTVK